MTLQNYTTYTEIDTPARITVAANLITIAGLDNDEASYVYYNFGAGTFNTDFEHVLKFSCTGPVISGKCYLWGLANEIDTLGTIIGLTHDCLVLFWDNGKIYLAEQNGAITQSTNTGDLDADTDYYIRIVKDKSVGTHGTVYVFICKDPYYQTVVSTLTLALSEEADFAYLYAVSGQGDGAGGTAFAGRISNLSLDNVPYYVLATLRTTVRDILNESTASFWSNAKIDEAINEAQRVTAILAKCIEQVENVNTVNGSRAVAFNDCHIEDIEYNSKALTRIKPKQIGTMPETTDDLGHFFEFDEKAMIEPIPGAAVPLVLYTIGEPTLMSAGASIPSTPLCYILSLIYYAVAYCWLLEKNYSGYGFMLSLYHDEVAAVTSIARSKVVDSYADLKGER